VRTRTEAIVVGRRLSRLDAGPSGLWFWPELMVALTWVVLFLATDVLFRDDESLVHRAAHGALWLSVALYVAVTLREHRSSEQ
jgi:hypothetical protein